MAFHNCLMEVITRLLNLFFPPQCASCQREGRFLCQSCVDALQIHPLPTRFHVPDARTDASQPEFEHLDAVIYAANYAKNPQLKAAIAQFKYRFTRELVDYFVTLVNRKLSELWMLRNKTAVLIPVPLHKKRLSYRGFNQSDLLVNGVASRYRGPIEIRPLLIRTKNTSQQARLTRRRRQDNLKGAFEVVGDVTELKDKVCFLVDDVCTTGSTLEECARVLKKAGLEKVYGLVIARSLKQ